MGKASREKAKHRAEAAPFDASRDTKPLSPLLRTLKNSKVTWTLVTGITLTCVWCAYEKMSPLFENRPKYSLEMVFLNHDSEEKGLHILDEVDKAKAEGKPIQIMFEESGFLRSAEYGNWVANYAKLGDFIRSNYQTLLANGSSPKDAELKLIESIHLRDEYGEESMFSKAITVGTAIRNMDALPIESLSEETSKKMLNGYNLAFGSLGCLMARNASLKEFAQMNLDDQKALSEGLRARNEEDGKGLIQRFEDATNYFPELANVVKNGGTVRGILGMGMMHAPIYYNFDKSDKTLELKMEVYIDTNSIAERLESEILKQTQRPYTEREAFLFGVDNILSSSAYVNGVRTNDPTMFNKVVNSAMLLTLDKLKELDAKSLGMDMENKGKFIFDEISKEN